MCVCVCVCVCVCLALLVAEQESVAIPMQDERLKEAMTNGSVEDLKSAIVFGQQEVMRLLVSPFGCLLGKLPSAARAASACSNPAPVFIFKALPANVFLRVRLQSSLRPLLCWQTASLSASSVLT